MTTPAPSLITVIVFLLSVMVKAGPFPQQGLVAQNGNCLEAHLNWTPYYATKVVGYWPLNGLLGSVTSIASNVGGPATYANSNGTGLSYITGKLGQGIKFDGVDDYAVLGTWSGTNTYSVSFWFKPGVSNSSQQTVFENGDSNNCFYNPSVYLTNNTGTIKVKESGCGGSGIFVTTTVSTTAWTHIVITKSGANAVVYINGTSVGSTSTAASYNAGSGTTGKTALGAGWGSSATTAYSDAAVDEVIVWSGQALTAPEVLSLYNAQNCQ